MPRSKDEIIREIGDAYDYGGYDDVAYLEELEGELGHIERLEGIAARMRDAGYAEWEVQEEVEEADASWRGVRANTEAHRATGAFIPTTPRILVEQPSTKAAEPKQELSDAPAEREPLAAAPADREATAFEAMLGDASAQAARENAPLAQQQPASAQRAR